MKFIFTALLSFITFGIHAQDYHLLTKRIDSLLLVKYPRTFNGVVLIQKDKEIIYSKAYGFSNFETKKALKLSDGFSTMSIAKQITTVLIMKEVENDNLNLDQPINDYLPDLAFDWTTKVTIRHLLNNSSGLSSDSLEKPLIFEPGSQFNYSNIGYGLLGQILENVTNKKYEVLVSNLFKKCQMTNSYYQNKHNLKQIVKGHTIKANGNFVLNDKVSFPTFLYPGSHLIVTAKDLAKWNYLLHNGQLLKDKSYQEMINYTVTAKHSLFASEPIGYGFGLRINDLMNQKEIGHTGFHPNEGFTAVNLYYPKSKMSVIVLENQANENFSIAYYFEEQVRKIYLKTQF